jgi:hypothetical protein
MAISHPVFIYVQEQLFQLKTVLEVELKNRDGFPPFISYENM